MGVSKNNDNDTPKSSILIGFSIINHPFWGTSIFGNIHVVCVVCHQFWWFLCQVSEHFVLHEHPVACTWAHQGDSNPHGSSGKLTLKGGFWGYGTMTYESKILFPKHVLQVISILSRSIYEFFHICVCCNCPILSQIARTSCEGCWPSPKSKQIHPWWTGQSTTAAVADNEDGT